MRALCLKITILIIFTMIVLIAREFGITCIFKNFLGFSCPGCGMTRACLSALRLDFNTAFSYHRMFWSVPVLIAYFIFDGRLFKNKNIDRFILIMILVGFIINWIINIFKY